MGRYASALVTAPDEPRRWFRRHPGWAGALAVGVVTLPLIVAVIALRTPTWYPVLDLAMTEYRVRDVGTAHTPLIGLPGRIGEYPNQGSHPGPLSFYLLAPTYRLLGSSSWALEAATVAIHVAAVAVALWIGHRRLGWPGVGAVGLLMAVVVRGYGQLPLTQPWNPYLPLIAWIVVLLAAWSVLAGDHWMLVPLVVAASYCAQTHVPYLPLGVGMVALGAGTVAWRWWRRRGATARPPDAEPGSPSPARVLLVSFGVGAILWLPPVADQIRHDPGNISQLLDHFGSPPEPAVGIGDGVELALRHLDVWAGVVRQVTDPGTFIAAASAWRGAVVLGVWVIAAVVAFRRGSVALRALHVVVGAGLVLGTVSMARIFGRPWFYLTLWAWGITALLVGAVAWTAVTLLRERLDRADRPRVAPLIGGAAAGLTVVISLVSAVQFADAHHPEERLSTAVGALAGPTYQAVADGVGAATGTDGRYLVRWSDAADIGSPGFGLLDELERRGLDVAADTYFHVPATSSRVEPRSWADAQIHLATGGYVERWRAVPDAVAVAEFDPRTPEQVAEYAEVRQRFRDRLHEEGLDELVDQIDTNLFGISIDTGLSAADHADLARMIDLGQPMVVFIAPPPAADDPNAL
jgi:hypothetical protein